MRNRSQKSFQKSGSSFLSAVSCLLLVFCLTACFSKPVDPEQSVPVQPLYWPQAPLQPRIEWIKEFKVFNRGGLNPGFWHRLSEGIFGKQDVVMRRPQAILFDEQQRLFVVDSGANCLHYLDMKSGEYTVLPENEEGEPVVFQSLVGVAEDDANRLYLTDSALGRIECYDLEKKKFIPFTHPDMSRPTGIVFHPKNRFLYVVDTLSHQVVALDVTGKEQFRFGSRGGENGAFNYPTTVTVNRKGIVLVTDAMNSRIQSFTPEGEYLCSFGKPGSSSGAFAKPKGLALDSDNHIYVADALFDAIQIFDNCDGQLLLEFGQSGNKPGEFWMPSGLFIDSNDFIYVADSYNQRVQVFRYLKDEKQKKKERN